MALLNKFEFERSLAKLEKAKVDLPRLIASDARNYFVNSFRRQGFDGVQWADVKRRQNPKKKRDSAPILVQSGNLRKAVQNSIRSTSWNRIVLGVDLVYAKIQNEGGTTSRGGVIKSRKFIGDSKELREILHNRISKEIKKIF